jgi:hypothetical protein
MHACTLTDSYNLCQLCCVLLVNYSRLYVIVQPIAHHRSRFFSSSSSNATERDTTHTTDSTVKHYTVCSMYHDKYICIYIYISESHQVSVASGPRSSCSSAASKQNGADSSLPASHSSPSPASDSSGLTSQQCAATSLTVLLLLVAVVSSAVIVAAAAAGVCVTTVAPAARTQRRACCV